MSDTAAVTIIIKLSSVNISCIALILMYTFYSTLPGQRIIIIKNKNQKIVVAFYAKARIFCTTSFTVSLDVSMMVVSDGQFACTKLPWLYAIFSSVRRAVPLLS